MKDFAKKECLKTLSGKRTAMNKATAYWMLTRFHKLTQDEWGKYIEPNEKKFEKGVK